jgi:starvation-inducible outer membrane lipoprotein
MTDSSAVKVYALALVLGLGLILTGCSSGPTAVQQQTEALRQVQTVTRDANAVYRAEGEYAQDV